jgi:GT2 family glycosyltransferase
MLIPIIQDYYDEGRIPIPKHRILLPFFPNCNLSARREVFEAVGGYDEALIAAEDSDLCRRAILAGYELFFEPKARVFHTCRPDPKSLIRQWYSYGYWSAAVYKKHMENRCEIYMSFAPVPRIHRFSRFIALRYFPIRMLFVLTYFAWILLIGSAALIFSLLGWAPWAGIAGMALLFLMISLYARHPVLSRLRLSDQLAFICISSLINISCLIGSILGGFRQRMLYVFSGI